MPKDNVTAYAWFTLANEGPADEGPLSCRLPPGLELKRVFQFNKLYISANLSLKQLHEMSSAQGGLVYYLEGVRYYAKQKRSKLAKQMTHNKIAEGQKLSKEMVKKNPKLL